jgi:hypothetical protein
MARLPGESVGLWPLNCRERSHDGGGHSGLVKAGSARIPARWA